MVPLSMSFVLYLLFAEKYNIGFLPWSNPVYIGWAVISIEMGFIPLVEQTL